ncbi:MAG: hypothetical protein ACYC11_10105 [Bellilinea sp.]
MRRFSPLHPTEGAVSPAEVRFLDLYVEPWEDNRRIRVHIRLTPFQKPPNLETSLVDAMERVIASATVIENIDFDLVFTLHIRPPDAPGPFRLTSQVEYEDLGVVDQKSIRFKLPVE